MIRLPAYGCVPLPIKYILVSAVRGYVHERHMPRSKRELSQHGDSCMGRDKVKQYASASNLGLLCQRPLRDHTSLFRQAAPSAIDDQDRYEQNSGAVGVGLISEPRWQWASPTYTGEVN